MLEKREEKKRAICDKRGEETWILLNGYYFTWTNLKNVFKFWKCGQNVV